MKNDYEKQYLKTVKKMKPRIILSWIIIVISVFIPVVVIDYAPNLSGVSFFICFILLILGGLLSYFSMSKLDKISIKYVSSADRFNIRPFVVEDTTSIVVPELFKEDCTLTTEIIKHEQATVKKVLLTITQIIVRKSSNGEIKPYFKGSLIQMQQPNQDDMYYNASFSDVENEYAIELNSNEKMNFNVDEDYINKIIDLFGKEPIMLRESGILNVVVPINIKIMEYPLLHSRHLPYYHLDEIVRSWEKYQILFDILNKE